MMKSINWFHLALVDPYGSQSPSAPLTSQDCYGEIEGESLMYDILNYI